jgi:outer membrane protein OmpA-like peptidoglycan-associated protein
MRKARRMAALAACLVVALAATGAQAEVFRFGYAAGEKYRILSTVHESVTVNGSFSHEAEILNKIAVEVTATRGDAGGHAALFQTSERAWGSSGSYAWGEDYSSTFWRDGRGSYDIDPSLFMPVVRDVPLFPEGDVPVGGTWSAAGHEVHDLRRSFGVAAPFRYPITVSYTYLRREVRNGVDCAVIGISYTVFHKVSAPPRTSRTYPVRVTGRSDQTYWWDIAGRRPLYDEEKFDFVFTLASGDEVEYVGDARGELMEAAPLDRAKVAEEIGGEIRRQGLEGTSVTPVPEGVMIAIEDVRFPPNSERLMAREQEKLRRIAEILKRYPDRDILITGHTARAPGYTEDDYQELSEKRAGAVADFLLSLGARRPEHMTARGMGARVPVGDNSTEEGMKRNRRVEITILEN